MTDTPAAPHTPSDDPRPSDGHALAVAALLVAAVAAANIASSTFGLIPAIPGTGLLVSAGTWGAGLALALRDWLHDVGGPRWVLGAIAAGIAVSLATGDGRVALASATAFALAELLDFAVYAALRRRARRTAVAASNAISAPIDTVLFLSIAGFGLSPTAVLGQWLVKGVFVTATYLVVLEIVLRSKRRRTVSA